MDLFTTEIEKNLLSYKKKIEYKHRYASFDYCFTYFQKFKHQDKISQISNDDNLELSVLQLSNYLASWGMFRGSTAMLRHSSHCLIEVIHMIAKLPINYWQIDIDNYKTTLNKLEEVYIGIGNAIKFPIIKDGHKKPQNPSPILVTKIMLGVFGNTPAMDNFFMNGILKSNFTDSNYYKSLGRVRKIWEDTIAFYEKNKDVIDKYKFSCINFNCTQSTILYTKAKLIDMMFFEKGVKLKLIET